MSGHSRLLAGMAVASLAGTVIGALSFRFGLTGVYFALLTIASAEFTRIVFDHFGWVGASSGLFLPVKNLAEADLINLRGPPAMFYYLMLALVAAALALSRALIRSRIGFYWQAIREDQDAAEALAGFFIDPSLKSMFSFGLLILVLLVRPQGLLGRAA